MTDLVYIMSPSYSGSTLLTFLLATHPEIATVGELKATAMGNTDEYLCSCGQRLKACRFWRELAEGFRRRHLSFSLDSFGTDLRMTGRPVLGRLLKAGVRGKLTECARDLAVRSLPPCRRQLGRALQQNRAFVNIVRRMTGARMFLDASKEPVRLKFLLQGGYFNIKTIYLIRDGRGAAHSFMTHHRTSMQQAAREWAGTHRQCRRMISRLGRGSWLRLRYEDLCHAPELTMAATFRFLGLNGARPATDFRSVAHHVIGNSMRLGGTSRICLDQKWRSALSAEQLAIFDRIAGSMNRQFGYA